jgi:carbonic anhydrase
MGQLRSISKIEDIPSDFHNTPVGRLLEYHNFYRSFDEYTHAMLLIGMCMDHRKRLRIPDKFAYIIRTGGANLRYNEFQVSYAVAVGGVKTIALIGHNDCGMVGLAAKKEKFINGLVEKTGWEPKWAEDHFSHFAPLFEIGNEIDFVTSEAHRLARRYPGILVAPMLYKVEDNSLYLICETESNKSVDRASASKQ